MKTTVNVNLSGIAYTLDKDAYEVIKTYLEDIECRLPKDEQKEVLEDIEARISELIGQKLFLTSERVVTLAVLRPILDQIGQPSDFGQANRPNIKPRNKSTITPLAKLLLFLAGTVCAFPLLVILFVLFVVCVTLFAVGAAFARPMIGIICALLVVILPLCMIIHTVVCLIRDKAFPKAKFWLITVLLWLAAIAGTSWMAVKGGLDFQNAQDFVANILNDHPDAVDAQPLIINEGWHSVKVSDACSVEIRQDSVCSFKADHPLGMQAWVEDSVLYITGLHYRPVPNLPQIAMPELRSLVVKDASKATVKGSFGTVNMRISDASRVEAKEAEIKHLTLYCTDASKATVYVTGTLNAQSRDASKVFYKGNPVILQNDTKDMSSIRQIK